MPSHFRGLILIRILLRFYWQGKPKNIEMPSPILAICILDTGPSGQHHFHLRLHLKMT